MSKQRLLEQWRDMADWQREEGGVYCKAQMEFLGLEDDGLASRQTGIVSHLAGNAREALEAFVLGSELGRKRLGSDVSFSVHILDTGDADMVRVPCRTRVELVVRGNTWRAAQTAAEMLLEIADGAAVMNQCQSMVVR